MTVGGGRSASGERGARPLMLIGCPAVLGEMAEGATEGIECQKLDARLHLSPILLRQALTSAVAEADKPGASIVLAFGMCSQAVLGLRTEHATLVVPKVDDCIAMFLGSNDAFEAEAKKARGTYYVAGAYLDECDTIFSDHEALVEKRGPERADKMMRLLLEGYTRIVTIDLGRHAPCDLRTRVTGFAKRFDLDVEPIQGTTRIVDALVADDWGDDFVVAPPGHELTLADFRPEFFSAEEEP